MESILLLNDGELEGTDGAAHVRLSDSYSEAEGVTRVAMLVWDTNTLAWIRYTPTAPGGGGTTAVSNFPATQAVTGPVTDAQIRATPLPVSGTVTANAGTGTMAVSAASLPLPSGAATSAKQDTEIASLASIDGKITAVNTGAVVVSSSVLPSGAATAAKQPALGAAGTPSADVLTVQGTASMTALKVDGSAVTQPVSGPLTDAQLRAATVPVSGTVIANAGTGTMAVSLATAPVLVTGSAIIGRVGIDQTTPGTTNLVALAANQSVNNAQIAGTAVSTGNGVVGTGVQRVAIASDNTAFAVNAAATQSGTWTVQPGNTPNTVPWLSKLHDGTNAVTVKAASTPSIQTDVALVIDKRPNIAATYTATANFTVPATPTDMLTISGSASKTIRVLRIDINATQTTAGQATFFLIKRSAANTAGTAVAQTAVPHDSANASATALINAYTANPSGLGAAVGTVRRSMFIIPALTSLINRPGGTWDLDTSNSAQAIVLRGTSQFLAVNFNGAALGAGFTLQSISVTWTEE